MKVKDDYARVGVPMLPVVACNKVVARQIVLYSWVMVAVSLLLTPLGYTGWFYTAVALGCRRLLALGGARAAEPGQGRGDRRQAQGDAAVPLVDHLCVAAVRRGRGGPLPALGTVRGSSRRAGVRGPCHAARPSPVDLPVGSILVMAETAETQQVDDSKQAAQRAERRAARLAKQIGAFAKAHGGAEGQLAYIGQMGARIVLVGEDGGWGDLVAPSYAIAESAATKAGITVTRPSTASSPPRSAPARTSGRGWPGSSSAARPTRPERLRNKGRSRGARAVSRWHTRATPDTGVTRQDRDTHGPSQGARDDRHTARDGSGRPALPRRAPHRAGPRHLRGPARGRTAGGPPAPGTTFFDTQTGFAVRRWCPPLLGLEPHCPPARYLARRRELGATRPAGGCCAAPASRLPRRHRAPRRPDRPGRAGRGGRGPTPTRSSGSNRWPSRSPTPPAPSSPSSANLAEAVHAAAARRRLRLARLHGCRRHDAGGTPPGRGGCGAPPRAGPALLRPCWDRRPRAPLQLCVARGGNRPVRLLRTSPRATAGLGATGLLHGYRVPRHAAQLRRAPARVRRRRGAAPARPRGADAVLRDLDRPPFGKLLFSSGAQGLPELHVVGARQFRGARLLATGWRTARWSARGRTMIAAGRAAVYGRRWSAAGERVPRA